MSEFIGSRISLISKSDVRYVGTLHEINSENSTVALENVESYGTEDRRAEGEGYMAPNPNLYEYIVFRGSDVKDLRIEEPPKETEPVPAPKVPDDPAILGSGPRPPPQQLQHQVPQQPPTGPRQPPPSSFQPQPPNFANQYGQFQNRFGPQGGPQPPYPGPPGGYPNYPGMPPYGPPPGRFPPPPGQGFPQPPPFSPPNQQQSPFGVPGAPGGPGMPPPYGQPPPQQRGPPRPGLPPAPDQGASPAGMTAPSVASPPAVENQPPTGLKADQAKSQSSTPAPAGSVTNQAPPPPPADSKPDVTAALAPSAAPQATDLATTTTASVPKGRIIPAVPFTNPAAKAAARPAGPLQANSGNAQTITPKPGQAAQDAALQYQNATQAATAAVAAAMAKLPPAPGQKPTKAPESDPVDNLTQKVNEMRTDDRIRRAQQQNSGGYPINYRGRGRGAPRRGGTRGVEVPSEDFDFEIANAKFNKSDLVKEAIATGSPVSTPAANESATPTNGAESNTENGESSTSSVPASIVPLYNKSSFFDNISSEAKEREETTTQGGNRRPSGHEMRTEERRKNYETFGMGSVDGGYRGGYRGRGRGRGGYRGNYRGNRSGYSNRGSRGGAQVAQPGA